MGEARGVLSEAQEQEVRAELIRLLQSPAFRTSKRCKEFLEYIVERTISGPSGALKERSIGVDLFQLPQDFDTGQHTIVRVTANEVRKKLARHYQGEDGSQRPVKIDLPPGSYSAEFKWEEPASEPVPEPVPPEQPAFRPNWKLIGSAVVLLAIAGGLAWWRWAQAGPTSSPAKANPVTVPLANSNAEHGDLRIAVGFTSPYVDRSGRMWGPDRFFAGGALVRSSERILRTLDPDLYRHPRQGDFRYDIPLAPGLYELHLHFAETALSDSIGAESSGEGQRVFRVSANGVPLLESFDVVADAAGANVADERVFRNVSPSADGSLHLAFASLQGSAMVNGIELLPMNAGKVRPVRIRAGRSAPWQDSAGLQWQADTYFMGGNALARSRNPARATNAVPHDLGIYDSERWGHFFYAVPVAEGAYTVTLKFCEGHFGRANSGVGGVGSRVFDVYCNGVALLRNFDIFKEAGGEGRPLDRTFNGIRPNAQGKISLSFVPVKGMASVNGIEVVEESR